MFLNIIQHVLFLFLHVEELGFFRRPLSKKEEEDYFLKMKQGDKEAKNNLVLHNMRLVAHIIKKYYTNSNEQEELLSIGTIGLIKAVSTFDYSKGTRFATYASRCIENEILMNFRSKKKQREQIYMGDPIDTDKDGNQLTLMDIIDDGNDIHEQVDTLIQSRQLYQFLEKCLSRREIEILVYRYGLYGHRPMTQKETAKKLGISRSYVSRLEKRAIACLRDKYNLK